MQIFTDLTFHILASPPVRVMLSTCSLFAFLSALPNDGQVDISRNKRRHPDVPHIAIVSVLQQGKWGQKFKFCSFWLRQELKVSQFVSVRLAPTFISFWLKSSSSHQALLVAGQTDVVTP